MLGKIAVEPFLRFFGVPFAVLPPFFGSAAFRGEIPKIQAGQPFLGEEVAPLVNRIPHVAKNH